MPDSNQYRRTGQVRMFRNIDIFMCRLGKLRKKAIIAEIRADICHKKSFLETRLRSRDGRKERYTPMHANPLWGSLFGWEGSQTPPLARVKLASSMIGSGTSLEHW